MDTTQQDEYFMRLALEQAALAEQINEIPVGAVIVLDNKVIGSGYNQNITLNDPSAHAEIMAMREAAVHLNNYRIVDAVIYVTLEPCPMCTGALVHSRIKRLVYGAKDYKTGACGSVFELNRAPQLNHMIDTTSGILADECSLTISSFFKRRRAEKKLMKQNLR